MRASVNRLREYGIGIRVKVMKPMREMRRGGDRSRTRESLCVCLTQAQIQDDGPVPV